MNATTSTLGLTLLVAALVVGMEQHREHQEEKRAHERTKAWNQTWQKSGAYPNDQNSPHTRSGNEKISPPHFLTESEQTQIFKTLDLAHQRLQREHDSLRLSKSQRREIFPLLVRLELDYQPDHPYPIGRQGHYISLGHPLSRADFESLLDPLLTPEQKTERETQDQENEVWWSHVIGRLEEDLNEQTETAPQPEPDATAIPIPLPEALPTPPAPDPAPHPDPLPETEAVAPSRNSSRGSRNLFDLLDS